MRDETSNMPQAEEVRFGDGRLVLGRLASIAEFARELIEIA